MLIPDGPSVTASGRINLNREGSLVIVGSDPLPLETGTGSRRECHSSTSTSSVRSTSEPYTGGQGRVAATMSIMRGALSVLLGLGAGMVIFKKGE